MRRRVEPGGRDDLAGGVVDEVQVAVDPVRVERDPVAVVDVADGLRTVTVAFVSEPLAGQATIQFLRDNETFVS